MNLCQKPIWSRSIEKKMIEVRKNNLEKCLEYKGYSAKVDEKDEFILSLICIKETDINDNVTYNNNEN